MKDSALAFKPTQEFIDAAMSIIREEFEQGLSECCQVTSLDRHYENFLLERDPVMFPLIEGMHDTELERCFVSLYDIYHTIATRSRFWLYSALVKIILLQESRFGRPVTHVFTRKSLASHGFDWNQTIASMGDHATEHLIGGTGNKKWMVNLDRTAFDEIGELAKRYQKDFDKADRFHPYARIQADSLNRLVERDEGEMNKVLSSLGRNVGDSKNATVESEVPIECDLLVISPHRTSDRLSIVAVRFVNRKTFKDKGTIINTRLNLLQLKAFIAQQRPERPIESINTWVCEIVDRNIERDYPFFSPVTYRSATQFWDEFIGVPFHLVRETIEDIGQHLLASSLRERLPR